MTVHPILLELRPFGYLVGIQSYGVCIALGTLMAVLVARRRLPASGLDSDGFLAAGTVGTLAGLIGARLTFVIQCGGNPFAGGFVLIGGLLTGLATGLAVARFYKLPVLKTADLAMPLMLLAAAFGRVGCFLAGCCFGSPCAVGMRYPNGSLAHTEHVTAGLIAPWAGQSLPTVPMPLLESLALLAVFAIGSVVWRKSSRDGNALAACTLAYSAWRFVAEFWRGDNLAYWGALTFSQGASMVLFVTSGGVLIYRYREALMKRIWNPLSWAGPVHVTLLLVGILALTGGINCGGPGGAATGCAKGCAGCATDPRAGERLLSRVKVGDVYDGCLACDAKVNGALDVSVSMDAALTVDEAPATGPLKAHGPVRELAVVIGGKRLAGTGIVEISVDRQLRVTIVKSTIPSEVLGAVKALEPFLGGKLMVAMDVAAPEAVAMELSKHASSGTAEVSGALSLMGERMPFTATAKYGAGETQWHFGE